MRTELESALREARALRFLCTGNVVRSAFAELYARHLGCPLPIDSAATRFQNDALFPETRAALAERGLPAAALAGFRPRHLTRLGQTDPAGLVVLAMSPEHLVAWRRLRPASGPGFLLAEALGAPTPIADPVLEGASFEATFGQVASCVEALVAWLKGPAGPAASTA